MHAAIFFHSALVAFVLAIATMVQSASLPLPSSFGELSDLLASNITGLDTRGGAIEYAYLYLDAGCNPDHFVTIDANTKHKGACYGEEEEFGFRSAKFNFNGLIYTGNNCKTGKRVKLHECSGFGGNTKITGITIDGIS